MLSSDERGDSPYERMVRKVLAERGKLAVDVADLDERSDLFAAGLTSHGAISVMLGLEDALDVQFPDDAMTKQTFGSIATLREVVGELVSSR